MSKYTKGPWTIEEDRVNGGHLIVREAREVCRVPQSYDKHDAEVDAANMSLIAAAPELLEALEKFVNWVHGRPGEVPRLEYIQELRNVIAKAKARCNVEVRL